jgi:LacI family repressor for deo operon, udp, cdd, tsx, nupC, and nupG
MLGSESTPKRPPTIVDVAAAAGVSPATVSRSLRGAGKVSDETRRRVLDAARTLRYVTSPHASGLATGRTGTVALVVPFASRWYFATALAAVTDRLREVGMNVLFYHLGSAAHREEFFEALPLARRVDAVVTVSTSLEETHRERLQDLGLPIVTLGARVPGLPSVVIDDEAASRTATTYLLNLGHERIAYIAGSQDDVDLGFTSSGDRLRGYLHAMDAAGLMVDDELVVSGTLGVRGGDVAMTQVLSGSARATAVLAEYDELAFGAMWALRRAGVRVPVDVSIVGIDDHEMAALMDLTTVRQPVHELGKLAADLVVDVLRGDLHPEATDLVLPTRFVVRGSTAPRRTSTRRAESAR